MRPIIEFCVSNLGLGSKEVKEALDQNPDYDVIEYGCLGNCGECFMFPYALVNGEIVAGETGELLLENIKKKLEEDANEGAV